MALTEYSCPSCGGQIDYTGGIIRCTRTPDHKWDDLNVFRDLRPEKKYEVAAAQFAPQQNHVVMKVLIPSGVNTALVQRWGDKLEATIGGVLTMLAEGECLIVPKTDLQRMKERLGKIPESSGELFGIVYNLGMETENAKAEAENSKKEVQAYEGRMVGMVLIDLGEQYENVVQRAQAQEPPEPVKWFIERNVKNALSQGWF
jgi:hypothetical protein